jgi:hypothetical protein
VKTSNGYEIIVMGRPDDGFTSAEIYSADDRDAILARVFELTSGWYFETTDLDDIKDGELVIAALAARDELMHYVNRKGAAEYPPDATQAAVSLWLMQRDDGKGFTLSNDK